MEQLRLYVGVIKIQSQYEYLHANGGDKTVGFLVGYTNDDTLVVTACIQCLSNNILAQLECVDVFLPGGKVTHW
jgi:hypothetical protein